VANRLIHSRALISALLLLVQVLGLGHLALAAHTVTNTGSIVDAAELSAEAHSHPAEHLCAGDVTPHAQNAGDECTVVAAFKTAATTASLVEAPALRTSTTTEPTASTRVEPTFALLFVAPKASPPQR
jgi:hypothetical protein